MKHGTFSNIWHLFQSSYLRYLGRQFLLKSQFTINAKDLEKKKANIYKNYATENSNRGTQNVEMRYHQNK